MANNLNRNQIELVPIQSYSYGSSIISYADSDDQASKPLTQKNDSEAKIFNGRYAKEKAHTRSWINLSNRKAWPY